MSGIGLDHKFENLKRSLGQLKKVAIAFSGGVDSTLLLKAACDVLGDGALAVTVTSPIFPKWETEEAVAFMNEIGAAHIIINHDGLDRPWFRENPRNRCYFCKKEIFSIICETAKSRDIFHVADGTNYDDLDDFRPGMQAVQELGVISPLKEAGLTKAEIRQLSKQMGLPTWDKPSYACLASRIPYGQAIDNEKLSAVDRAESFIRGLGFKQLRVRHHGDIARIEVAPEERRKLFDENLMDRISEALKEIGFTYVSLELGGYRTGSMNDLLTNKEDV
jgi:uncharacterized protein